jgi:hypothetical protein
MNKKQKTKDKNYDWSWNGRYGDREERVKLSIHPSELSETRQKKLRKQYEEANGRHDLAFENLGLVREGGNAWNHISIWAPIVHEWMKKKNNNAEVQTRIREQYRYK